MQSEEKPLPKKPKFGIKFFKGTLNEYLKAVERKRNEYCKKLKEKREK